MRRGGPPRGQQPNGSCVSIFRSLEWSTKRWWRISENAIVHEDWVELPENDIVGCDGLPMKRADQAEERFEFGRNWKKYVEKSFDQERVDVAKAHLCGFLQRADLH